MKKFLLILVVMLTGCSNAENHDIKITDYNDYLSVINTYPHNTSSFTQGLFFDNGMLYESTGEYGWSKIYKDIDLLTGKPSESYSLDSELFGEGAVIFKNKLYVLTWKEGKALIMDPDEMLVLETLNYDKEGFGLTTDGKYLIASDGSSKLYFMNEGLDVIKEINVTFNGNKVEMLNELEYIDGYIWANIWQTNFIVVINPENGNVVKKIDFTGILDENLKDENTDVLNGIAYNDDKIYITGKRWPLIFECKLK